MPKDFNAWPPGLSRSLYYPDVPIYRVLDDTARRVPDRTALILLGHPVTYVELRDLADRFAATLVEAGVRRGDRVVINLPNCPQFAVAYYGLLKAGAIFSPVSPLLAPGEIECQIRDCGAESIITLDQLYGKIEPVLDTLGVRRRYVVSLGDPLSPLKRPAAPPPEGSQAFNQILLDHQPLTDPVEVDPVIDLGHIAYTGGTTGLSKGVMLTHKNVVSNVLQNCMLVLGAEIEEVPGEMRVRYPEGGAGGWSGIFERDSEVALMVPPWFHAMGVIALNNHVFLGSTMVVFPRFDPTQFLAAARKYKATFMNGAPPVYRLILGHPGFTGTELANIKWAVSGAAPLPVSLLERMLQCIPGVITEGYGLSECTSAATTNLPLRESMRPGSIGLPLFDTELKVVDPVTGTALSPGSEGEICIRGPQVMLGYWNKHSETADVLRDGWLHTGDIGREDKDGFFYITDRIKDMVLYKGYNVYPRELEEILNRHPVVEISAVLGRPDPDTGEAIVAFVQARPGTRPEGDKILDFVNSRVAHYKKIKEIIIIDEIPISGPGKILKRVLREKMLVGIQGGP
jgi:long-chain acyl-CoA synthetase